MKLSHYEWDPEKDLIAEGGFAEVFKAKDMNTANRWVALKIYKEAVSRGTTGSTGQKKYSLEQEFAKIDGLSHTNIITFYGLEYIEHKDAMGRTASYPVLIMEYAGEGTLKELSVKQLSDQDLEEIIVSILKATSYLHSQGVIHRDLKPGNVLFSKDRNGKLVAKITDFGISKDVLGDKTIEQSFTEGVGTPHYMAPEQFFKKKFGLNGEVSERTDIWAIGIIVYQLLTGKRPFGQGMKDYELIRDEITQKEVDLTTIPEKYKTIITRCLEKEAGKRASSANELLKSLEPDVYDEDLTIIPGQGPVINDPPTPEVKPKKNLLTYAIVSILLLAIGFGGFKLYEKNKVSELLNKAWNHYKKGEHKDAYALYNQASTYNSGEAFYYLSILNENGYGTEMSYNKAKEFSNKAIEKGYKMANFQLGWRYQNSIGVESDTVKSKSFFSKAINDIITLSNDGNPEAQNLYGIMYQHGLGINKDIEKTKEYFLKAVDQGHPAAISNMANLYRSEKKYKEAIELYKKGMAIKRYDCYRNMGDMHRHGLSVPKDTVKAFQFYITAAENKDLRSQYLMGTFYYNGILVKKDEIKAIAWYTKAAEKGYLDAQNELGRIYYRKENYKGAEKWFLMAAESGNRFARHNLGNLYFSDKIGKPDYKKAEKWYLKSANQGFSWSQERLGYIYEKALLGEQDCKKALGWYEKSVKQEYVFAQYNLASLYYEGTCVVKDLSKAKELFAKSADQNNSNAQYMLGKIAGGNRNYLEAKKWYEKSRSVKGGNVNAILALGDLYYSGNKDIKIDHEKALKLYLDANKKVKKINVELKFRIGKIYYNKKKYYLSKVYLSIASDKNHAEAQLYLASIYDKGYTGKIDYAKAFNHYLKAANKGNKIAQYSVGIYYFYGRGIPRNKISAKYWLNKSCSNNHQEACNFVRKNF